jgi:hypothetical protein
VDIEEENEQNKKLTDCELRELLWSIGWGLGGLCGRIPVDAVWAVFNQT